MFIKLLALLLFLYTSVGFAQKHTLASWQFESGPKCNIYFDDGAEDFIGVKWDGRNDPPVNISKARKIFQAWISEKFGDNIDSHIVGYNLTSFRGSGMRSNHWVYVINYLKFIDGKPHADFDSKVAILMNGVVIDKSCK